ncbi:uncharacterized protein LOC106081320 [Stomoxys calcitrans]|uniref:uncharacterized protein LOC106081320 n=1 Tax=Stomoxys calcitrans TaxID=35570 RepID=UPI0027E384A2|nr:uncharacterized protein LOC106081320 [Stomoxys calcitrans]
MWNIMCRIQNMDKQILKGYLYCRFCHQAFACPDGNCAQYSRHECCLELEKLVAADTNTPIDVVQLVTSQIANGNYTVAPRKNAKTLLWQIMGDVSRQDGKVLKNIVCCTVCKQVRLNYLIKTKTLIYKHGCIQRLKQSEKFDVKQNSKTPVIEEPSCSQQTLTNKIKDPFDVYADNGGKGRKVYVDGGERRRLCSLVLKKITQSHFTLFRRDTDKSFLWKVMGRIQKEDKTTLEGYLYCRKCHKVYTYKQFPLNLMHHRCIKELKQLAGQYLNVEEEPNDLIDIIAALIDKGVFRTVQPRNYKSSVWNVLSEIQDQNGKIFKRIIYCRECCAVIERYTKNQSLAVFRHKCCQQQMKKQKLPMSKGLEEEEEKVMDDFDDSDSQSSSVVCLSNLEPIVQNSPITNESDEEFLLEQEIIKIEPTLLTGVEDSVEQSVDLEPDAKNTSNRHPSADFIGAQIAKGIYTIAPRRNSNCYEEDDGRETTYSTVAKISLNHIPETTTTKVNENEMELDGCKNKFIKIEESLDDDLLENEEFITLKPSTAKTIIAARKETLTWYGATEYLQKTSNESMGLQHNEDNESTQSVNTVTIHNMPESTTGVNEKEIELDGSNNEFLPKKGKQNSSSLDNLMEHEETTITNSNKTIITARKQTSTRNKANSKNTMGISLNEGADRRITYSSLNTVPINHIPVTNNVVNEKELNRDLSNNEFLPKKEILTSTSDDDDLRENEEFISIDSREESSRVDKDSTNLRTANKAMNKLRVIDILRSDDGLSLEPLQNEEFISTTTSKRITTASKRTSTLYKIKKNTKRSYKKRKMVQAIDTLSSDDGLTQEPLESEDTNITSKPNTRAGKRTSTLYKNKKNHKKYYKKMETVQAIDTNDSLTEVPRQNEQCIALRPRTSKTYADKANEEMDDREQSELSSSQESLTSDRDNTKLDKISDKIAQGIYTLDHQFKGKSMIWNVMRKILKTDGSLLRGYLYCRNCCKTFSYDRKFSNFNQHECCKKFEFASLADLNSARFPQGVNEADEESKNIYINDLISDRIAKEIYTISQRSQAKNNSFIWHVMAEIRKGNGRLLQNKVYCRKCHKVFNYFSQHISSLKYHKCCQELKDTIKAKNSGKGKPQRDDDINSPMSENNSTANMVSAQPKPTEGIGVVEALSAIEDGNPYFDILTSQGFPKLITKISSIAKPYGSNINFADLLPDSYTLHHHLHKMAQEAKAKVKNDIVELNKSGALAATIHVWNDTYIRRTFVGVLLHYHKDSQIFDIAMGMKSMDYEKSSSADVNRKLSTLFNEFGIETLNDFKFVSTGKATLLSALETSIHLSSSCHLLNVLLNKAFRQTKAIETTINACQDLIKYLKNAKMHKHFTSDLLQHQNNSSAAWYTAYKLLQSFPSNWLKINEILADLAESSRMSDINIVEVKALVEICNVCEQINKRLQNSTMPTLCFVLPSILKIKNLCAPQEEDLSAIVELKANILKFIDNMWTKKLSIWHKAAYFLYPPAKNLQTQEDLLKIKKFCLEYMNKTSKSSNKSHLELPSSSSQSQDEDVAFFFSGLFRKSQSPDEEIESYIREEFEIPQNFDLLRWWTKNSGKYPNLSKLALQIHSIPASSTTAEKVFSLAGNTNAEERNKLLTKSMDIVVFLHSYYKNYNFRFTT